MRVLGNLLIKGYNGGIGLARERSTQPNFRVPHRRCVMSGQLSGSASWMGLGLGAWRPKP